MVGTKSKWEDELGRWLKPFLDRLGHKARRRMCPLYISGLIGPGDRKSVQPIPKKGDRFGWCRSTICLVSRQNGQLPNIGVADACEG